MFKRNYINRKAESTAAGQIILVEGLGEYDLTDTMECGQCFRHVRLFGKGDEAYTEPGRQRVEKEGDPCTENPPYNNADGCEGSEYTEYLTVVDNRLVRVGQRKRGELIFYDTDCEFFDKHIVPYFSLDKDFEAVRASLKERTSSELLRDFADRASGVVLLTQNMWETVFSFIISSNNNIPRIRKIIRKICAEYGENLAIKEGLSCCPVYKNDIVPDRCKECGICYSFPSPENILSAPDKMLSAKPGFRYRYLVSAAQMVDSGEINLAEIKAKHSYEYTLSQLKRIVGVGDKVASCAALFAFENYEAFPIDVWIKRAIDEYFGGSLDISALGEYAGVAQQYIFHSIRNLNQDKK